MISTTARVSPRPPVARGDELVSSVHGVMKTVLHRLHPSLDDAGVSMGQFWAMHLVSSLRSPSMTTVARHLSVTAPTLCASIDQLEAAGLVTRHRSTRDRRSVDLQLTPRGKRVEARVWAQIGVVMAEAARDLPPEDIATTIRVFHHIQSHLGGPFAAGGSA